MKLTSYDNGMVIDVDRDKLEYAAPHSAGGSVVQLSGMSTSIHVHETVNDILNDRTSPRTT